VHTDTFSYTNSTLLFAIKYREKVRHQRYSSRLTVIRTWKRQGFIS